MQAGRQAGRRWAQIKSAIWSWHVATEIQRYSPSANTASPDPYGHKPAQLLPSLNGSERIQRRSNIVAVLCCNSKAAVVDERQAVKAICSQAWMAVVTSA